MKVLLQNYSSPLSTEPMYFYRCLNHAGIATSLWSDPRTSAFDAFDMFKPDVFIGHWKFLTSDVVKYLSQNKSIQTALNVSFATQEDIEKIDQVLDSSSVSVDFLFTNQHEALYKLKSKYKLVNIVPAADVFIPTDSSLKDWKNECAILSTTPHEMFLEACKNQEVYHKLCFGTQSDAFDISVDIQSLPSLVPKYNKVFIVDDINIATSQVMFEVALRCSDINIKVPEKDTVLLGQVFASLFSEDKNEARMSDLVQKQIIRKHNCFKRTARLARLFKNSEAAQTLEKTSEQIGAETVEMNKQ